VLGSWGSGVWAGRCLSEAVLGAPGTGNSGYFRLNPAIIPAISGQFRLFPVISGHFFKKYFRTANPAVAGLIDANGVLAYGPEPDWQAFQFRRRTFNAQHLTPNIQ